jgi:type II restriction enzyme
VRYSSVFKDLLNCSTEDETFAFLCKTLNDSITYWDYFVNWEKVLGNTRDLEIDLNTLNYLIGKVNIEQELKLLLHQQPSVARLIPVLLACRESSFKILVDFAAGELKYETFSFSNRGSLSAQDIESACRFARETGLLEMFRNRSIKSIPDYVIGVEVGLDSNGRKNRGGTAMETIVESLLTPICSAHNLGLMKQASAEKIRLHWNIPLEVDKSSRRFDFAVRNGDRLYLVETNYYGGGGSKLKSTAGEYRALHDFLSAQGRRLVWITDGLGWRSTLRPLEETFRHIDYTLNLKMVTSGLLSRIIIDGL